MMSLFVIKSYLKGYIVLLFIFFMVSDYYDIKFGIIPNKLNLFLFNCGLLFNLLLAISFENLSIFLDSLALTALIGMLGFLLWHIGFWGGGDLKFFIGLSLSLFFLDFDYLDFGFSNPYSYALNECVGSLGLPILNQLTFYPKVITILLDGILIAFLFIIIVFICYIIRERQLRNSYLFLITDFKSFFNRLTVKSIDIYNLNEGMVLNKYYFNDVRVCKLIGENNESTNLKFGSDDCSYDCFEDEIFYLMSLSSMGLNEWDIAFLKDSYEEGLIKNPNFQIKMGIPFMPFLTLGFIGFLIFGDFIYLISNFIKYLF